MKNINLKPKTTFGVGGVARQYLVVRNSNELIRVIKQLIKNKEPYILIAGGSNVVFPDGVFDKTVVHLKPKIFTDLISVNKKMVTVEAGVPLSFLIKQALVNNLAGLESLSGIPGSVGGAIVGNAGAYGQTISDHLVSVTVFDGQKIFNLTKDDCRFKYRHSLFKEKNLIVLKAKFKLTTGDGKELKKKSNSIIKTRNAKYVPGIKCPGSFFKNVLIKDLPASIVKKIDQTKIIDGKIPAGYLLEQVGAKGMKEGDIFVASFHGNLIINKNSGSFKDLEILVKKLKSKVKKRFGINLEEEVRYMV